MKRISSIFFTLVIIFFFLPSEALAHHRERVLGISTSSSLSIPATIEGPGFILPDSPLFFLDEVKQRARVFLAFTPSDKAKVHAAIAGERLAELRFMLSKNNQNGIDTALRGVSDNFRNAGRELNQARMFGKNVSELARNINDNIKLKQQMLDQLEEGSSGEMKAKVKAAGESLLEAKVEVEEALPDDELETEIEYDLARKVKRYVDEADYSAKSIEYDLVELEKQASAAATNSQKKREEAVKRVIVNLKNEEEAVTAVQIKNDEKKIKLQKETIEQARKAVKEAKDAAEKFKKASEEIKR